MIQKFNYSQADINARVNNISRYSNSIDIIGNQLGVDPAIIKALIAIESSGNPNAGAGRVTGAKGLMQVIKTTWESTITNFSTVRFRGVEIKQYYNRDEGDAWADPELNILIGTLTLILKARSLTKMTSKTISADDPNDAAMLFTAYNAGEYTVMKAFQRAVAAGCKNPEWDFLDPPHLKGAIGDVVSRFNLSWDVDKKYKEISEYAGRVLTFLELYRGNNYTPTPVHVQHTPTPTPTYTQPTTNTQSSIYVVIAGDSGYRIASKLGISFSELSRANPAVKWSALAIGQKLNNPKGSSAPTPTPTPTYNPVKPTTPKTYLVVRGDTLGGLARKFGVSIDAIKNANRSQLKRWGSVEGFLVGAKITIPG